MEVPCTTFAGTLERGNQLRPFAHEPQHPFHEHVKERLNCLRFIRHRTGFVQNNVHAGNE